MNPAIRAFAAGVALLTLAAADSRGASAPVTEFFGEISDSTGDSIQWPWEPTSKPAPDLVYASALAADGRLHLTARFDPGTYAEDTIVHFALDTDADPSTGWPGTTTGGSIDREVLGMDYYVEAKGAGFGGYTMLVRTQPQGYTVIATDLDITFHEDGLDVSFPLSLIGDDDGRLHFKVLASVQINDAGVTWQISDFITDANQQPGSTVPAAEEVADLGEAINDLETSGALNQGPARALSNHLENGLRALEVGHNSAARAQLEAFIEQVLDLVAEGTLTEEEAAPLIATALRLLAGM